MYIAEDGEICTDLPLYVNTQWLWDRFLFPGINYFHYLIRIRNSAIHHTMFRKLGDEWITECLNTKFSLASLSSLIQHGIYLPCSMRELKKLIVYKL